MWQPGLTQQRIQVEVVDSGSTLLRKGITLDPCLLRAQSKYLWVEDTTHDEDTVRVETEGSCGADHVLVVSVFGKVIRILTFGTFPEDCRPLTPYAYGPHRALPRNILHRKPESDLLLVDQLYFSEVRRLFCPRLSVFVLRRPTLGPPFDTHPRSSSAPYPKPTFPSLPSLVRSRNLRSGS